MNKIVAMFPGQGSQYVGMGKDLYKKHKIVQEKFDIASKILDYDLAKLCFEGPSSDLLNTENAQVAVLTLSIGMYEYVKQELNLKASYLIGHSLGEISALTAAGVFDFIDAIKLVKARGKAMAICAQQIKTSMMAVSGVNLNDLVKLVGEMEKEDKYIQIANYNSPNQIILSGALNDLKIMNERFDIQNVKTTMLNVSGAFHSKYMNNAAKELKIVLEPMKLNKFQIPVMNCANHRFYTNEDDIKDMLVRQIVEPVKWYDSVRELEKKNIAMWLEFGSKDVLKKLVLSINSDAKVYSLENDIESMFESIDKFNKEELNRLGLVELCLGAAAATRNRNWNEEEYQAGVVVPYQKLQKICEIYEQKKYNSLDEMNHAIELLHRIFDTKMVPKKEQEERLQSIIIKSNNEEVFPQYFNISEENF